MNKQELLKAYIQKQQKPVLPVPVPEVHEIQIKQNGKVLELEVPPGAKGDPGHNPVLGVDYMTPADVSKIKQEVTPVKGQDYFTPDEIESAIQASTPIKGVHYFDGKTGPMGPAGKDSIIPGPKGERGEIGPAGRDGVNPKPSDVITEIKALKGNARLDLSNIRNGEQLAGALAGVSTIGKRLDTLDERWHGGGITNISANGTSVTTSGTSLNFAGSGVSGATVDQLGNVTVNISGGGSSGLVVGTTPITGATNGQILYNNNGVLGAEMYVPGGVTSFNSRTGVVTLTSGDVITALGYTPGQGTVTSFAFTNGGGFTGTVTSATTTPTLSLVLQNASTSQSGQLTSTDWNTFNNKQGTITLTTVGTSGAATFSGGTLNIPQYAGTTYTAGTGLTLTTGTFSVNTSQNIATLSNLTSNGLIKTSGGTGTLSIATAGTDYQAPISLTTTGSGAATFALNVLNIPTYTLPTASTTVLGGVKVDGTSITISGGVISAATGSSGITRSVNNISTNTTAGSTASTDYVYYVTGTTTLTLPSATGNTNLYTVINSGTGVITVAATINGATNDVLYAQYDTSKYQSNGTNWFKVS